jgi:transporter family-2 protein
METLYMVAAMVAGACAPIQAGVNAQLRLWTRDPVIAAMISFFVGAFGLFAYAVLSRAPFPDWTRAGDIPLWQWSGGLLGGFLVFITVALAPHLGAAALMGLMLTGQMVASLVLDHFGWVGYKAHAINGPRVIGIALIIVGTALVKKY